MKRVIGYTLAALLVGLDLVVGSFLLSSGKAQVPGDDAAAWLRVFTRAFELVKQDYVDPKKATSSHLLHASLREMLSKLDPHSAYLEAEDYQDFQEENRGEVTGIGIVVADINSQLTVVSAVEEAPAAKAGIVAGDQIVAIEGVNVEHKRVEDIGPLLRGAKGKIVHLKIYRPSTKSVSDIQVTRQIYRVTSVRDAHLLDDGEAGKFKIGYLRITEFDQPTPAELGAQVIDTARDPRLAAEHHADEDAVDPLEHVRVGEERESDIRLAERKHLHRGAADVHQASVGELHAFVDVIGRIRSSWRLRFSTQDRQ